MVGRIGAIGTGFGLYGMYTPALSGSRVNASSSVTGPEGVSSDENTTAAESKAVKQAECQTCKNRKYVDGSDEMVSFKSPAKMEPGRAAAGVRAHEQEHVSNAFKKAADMDGKVLQASVAIKMAICPECGRTYVAGGTTTTKIAYNKDNPYEKNQKSLQKEATTGNNFDEAV